jgi:replication-associated recombination protein RarA
MSEDVLNSLWVEKYRPKKLEDVVLSDQQRGFLSKCVENCEIPHLLLIGPPGSGKCHDGEELLEIYIDD